VYLLEGTSRLGPSETRVSEGQLAVLGPGNVVSIASDVGGRMLLLSAEPIGEPVARRGPFVMNTEEELDRAIDDYRTGRLLDG